MSKLSEIVIPRDNRPGVGTGIHRKFGIPVDVDLNHIVPDGAGVIMCSVCENLTDYRLDCGHEVCGKCFENLQVCPKHKDGVRINQSKATKMDHTFQVVSCPYKSKGCKLQIHLDEIINHLKICNYKIIDCSRCEEKILFLELGPHLSSGCELQMHECPFCSIIMNSDDISKHLERCPRKHEYCCHSIIQGYYEMDMNAKKIFRVCCPRSAILFFGNSQCFRLLVISFIVLLVPTILLSVAFTAANK